MSPVAVAALAVVVGLGGFLVGRIRSRAMPDAEFLPPTEDEVAPPEPDSTAGPDPRDLFARLAQAVDEIEHGVIVADAAGADLFRNRAARAYSEARDGLVLVEAAVQELIGEALTGLGARREVDLFGPPAQSFVVSAHPFGGGGGALAVIEDRSLQRRTETVRRDFVANISHELKTPIGALGLLAETIRDEPDPEVVARLSARMIVEADRASRTVDDLLELSRIEFGDEAELSNLLVSDVIGEAVGRIAPAAEQAGVLLRVAADPDLSVRGDRRQLVSALFNLLDNAVKYSPVGSEVVVESGAHAPGGVHLAVIDAGIGIPRRDLDRVFERFYRVDRARSRGTGGTGLGLAIVRHVASNHGGEVAVESIEGVGTTVTLTLPAVLAADVGRVAAGQDPTSPLQGSTSTPIGTAR